MTDGLMALTNASAGSADEQAVRAALAVLHAGTEVEVVATASPRDCADAVRRLAGRRLAVFGGDGSMHLVAQALHESGQLDHAAVGLVPLGTGNDLARTTGIPLDPAEAARVVLDGAERAMELLVDDAGGVVVNAVHLGAGAEAARAAEAWKPRVGKAAYAVGALSAGVRHPGWRVWVTADGRQLADPRSRVLMVGLGVGRSIGGGAELAPRASPTDGLVDVIVSEATGPLARLGYAVRLRGGRHVERPDVHSTRAREVAVQGEPFYCNADGEVVGPLRARTWTVQPAAWRLLVPRSSPSPVGESATTSAESA
ncbi:YegS/Rv2252/BmrU family lipid kinase [soil metagenome]|jgi:YegS/Rv2252/BmrU family lipid kinase